MNVSFKPILHIDLDAVAFNLNSVATRARVDKSSVIGVVKDDAYGIGLLPVAQKLVQEGVKTLAVARFETAQLLRKHGFTVAILVLGPVTIDEVDFAFEQDITLTILDTVQLSNLARRFDKVPKYHLLVDTGMARYGITYQNLKTLSVQADLRRIRNYIQGVYTHFHSADVVLTQTVVNQRDTFAKSQVVLGDIGVTPEVIHCANSAGALFHDVPQGELIRPGISLYGCSPDPAREVPNTLRSVVRLTARVGSIRKINAGESIGYGHAWTAPNTTNIATVSIGYGLGYPRSLSNKGEVLIAGKRYSLVGRVTMDSILVDIGNASIEVGDEVVLVGRSEREIITVDNLAIRAGTIGYEILCGFGAHLKRHYFE